MCIHAQMHLRRQSFKKLDACECARWSRHIPPSGWRRIALRLVMMKARRTVEQIFIARDSLSMITHKQAVRVCGCNSPLVEVSMDTGPAGLCFAQDSV